MLLRSCGPGVAVIAFVVAIALVNNQASSREISMGGKEVVGQVKEVDLKQKSFVIVGAEDKNEQTFLVNKETKFVGPRGGIREDGLKDDCMSQGYEVRVVPAADAKYAKEVKLSAWKGEVKGKKKGG